MEPLHQSSTGLQLFLHIVLHCAYASLGKGSGNTGISEVVVGGGGQTVLTPEPWAQWLHYTRYSLPLSP